MEKRAEIEKAPSVRRAAREDVCADARAYARKRRKGEKLTRMQKLVRAFLVLCGAVGVGLLLVRPVGVFITDRQHEAAIKEYIDAVNKLDDAELSAIRERALGYNADYAVSHPMIWGELSAEGKSDYPSELNVPGTDVMAYLEIPAIDVRLPIYHFASDKSMKKGCGHMECSSLPICGGVSHTILMSHRNMASSVTFEDLDKLDLGDTFSITVLDETIPFCVDDIRVVDPERVEEYQDMMIEDGKDYCTLFTCTPDGKTTHRLLVRGVRSGG